MSFNTQKFLEARLYPREHDVPVPDLKDFFEDKKKAVWKVRGITGQELGRANEAADKLKNVAAILDGVLSSVAKDKADAWRKAAGMDESETPRDTAKRLEMLVIGSVEPKCTWELAIKICEKFPVEFYALTNKITELTGQGHVPGKPAASGKKRK